LQSSWGRILAATGSVPLTSSLVPTSPPHVDPTKVSVTFVPSDGTACLPVLSNGEPESVDENRAKQILTLDDINIVVDLGMGGDGEATYWTCDLSYVSIVFSASSWLSVYPLRRNMSRSMATIGVDWPACSCIMSNKNIMQVHSI